MEYMSTSFLSQKTRILFGGAIIASLLLLNVPIVKGFDCLVDLNSNSAPEQKEMCNKQLLQLEAELKEKEAELSAQRLQTGSLQRDVNILTKEIESAKTKIKARTLAINKIGTEIVNKNKTIESLEDKMDRQRESLAQLVRKTHEMDDSNIMHLVLSSEDISQFYGDIDTYSTLKKSVKSSVDEIKGVKQNTEEEKKGLEKKKDEELDAKSDLEIAKKKVEISEAEKKKLVSVSKTKEKTYEQIVAEKRANAAKIRAALFKLRDSAAIPFGKALEYAQAASKTTGVRPAFLLAILTQESNLGANVGQCYLKDKATGAGVGKNTGTPFAKVMKPMGLPGRKGDVDDFLLITSLLGRQWDETPVSCPIGNIGYGGAMGPAQFIPTTWMMYRTRLANALGKMEPDPWNPQDAFMASSAFLGDLGASAQTYTAERNAACRYYGGGSGCTATTAAYGNSVMTKAASIQLNQIDPLEGL